MNGDTTTIRKANKSARGRHAASWVLVFGFVSGCVSILGLDDYSDASDELCTLYAQCYGASTFPNCKEHLDNRVAEGGVEVAQWLSGFFAEGCLQDCKSARSCVDAPPICGDAVALCTVDEQCCSFSEGLSICTDGQCCFDLGALCDSNEQCCNDACLEVEGASFRTCGGVQCGAIGDTCDDDSECCSSNCFDGICLSPCVKDKATCDGDGDCCSERCIDGACECGPDGASCESSEQCCGLCESGKCKSNCEAAGGTCDGDAECCSDNCFDGACCNSPGTECNNDGECCAGVCTDGSCRCSAPGGNCDVDADCCLENAECSDGVCVCSGVGDACSGDLGCCFGSCDTSSTCTCTGKGQACSDAGECCSDLCDGGACGCLVVTTADCANDQQCCGDALCVDRNAGKRCCNRAANCLPVTANGSVDAACSASPKPLDPKCDGYGAIEAICASKPECCCAAWTQQCVNRYKMMGFCSGNTTN